MTLDARQRAMLAEMGVRVWQPEPVARVAEPSEQAPAEAPAVTVTVRDASETIAVGARQQPAGSPKHAETAVPRPRAAAPVGTGPAAPAQAAPAAALGPRPEGVAQMDWPALEAAVAGCRACGLCAGRTNTVFGIGSHQADWMVIGEAPGENEDRQGQPFVGQAGKLLDQMLAAIGVSRDAGIDTNLIAGGAGEIRAGGPKDPENGANEPRQGVFIANVLKCRPPGNRNPLPEEIAQCEPYLRRQVALVRPKIILAMGRFAVQSLLQTSEPIGRLRGRVHRYEGVPVIVTYHPAYLLRALPEKAKAWEDLCLALATAESQTREG